MIRHKVELWSNGCWQEVRVNGEYVMADDGLNTNELLYRLSEVLGFDYEGVDADMVSGKWVRS